MAVSETDSVLRRMLGVEGQAREALDRAGKQAQEILAAAREQVRRLGEEAKEAAQAQSRRLVAEAVTEAERQRDERIAAEMAADAPVVKRGRERAPEAVRLVVRETAAL